MKTSISLIFLSFAVSMAGGPASAATLPTVSRVQWGRGRGNPGGDVIRRAMNDLERAQSSSRFTGSDRDNYNQARKNLSRFESNYSRGQFDRDRLDGAIENFSHLANSGRVNGRMRQMLAEDAQALRDFRASGGRGGQGPGRRY